MGSQNLRNDERIKALFGFGQIFKSAFVNKLFKTYQIDKVHEDQRSTVLVPIGSARKLDMK